MRSSYPTLLSLFEWGKIMGLSPWDLAQVGEGFANPSTAQCEKVFFQYSWQEDFLSRDEVGESIEKAEDMIAQELGYYPAPKYFVGETHMYPRPAERYLYGAGTDKRYQWKVMSLDFSQIQSPGLQLRTLIAAGVAVTRVDRDGDGILETFTIGPIATTVTDPSQIGIYFTLVDRLQAPIDDTWQIRPITVSISGGNVTITGHSSCLVLPAFEETMSPISLNVGNAAIYATSVDLYQLTQDLTTTAANPAQGVAIWTPIAGDCDNPPCNQPTEPICVMASDAANGTVAVDYLLDGINCPWWNREPDKVTFNYLAGVPLVNGRMRNDMAKIVAHLATAILPIGKCGCDRAQRIIDYWRRFPNDTDVQRPMTQQEINENRFGAQRGAAYAWKRVMNLRRLQSVSI